MSRQKKDSPILSQYLNPDYRIYLKATNVLRIEATAELEYGASLVQDIINNSTAVTGGKKALVLIIAGQYTSINLDGLRVLAKPEAFAYAHAKAYVINNLAQRLVANFYLRFFKPRVPVKIFTDARAGEAWLLKNFRHIQG